VTSSAVASSVLAPVLLVLGWWYAVSLHPGFDPVRQPVSDLTAANAPNRWTMTLALMAVGVCHVVTARGFRAADPTGRWLLAAGGVSLVVLALIPNRTVGSYYLVHSYWSALTFGFLALWPTASSRFGDRVPWPLRLPVGLAGSVVTFLLVLLTAVGMITESDTLGLREHAVYAWTTAWPLVVVAGTRAASRAP
jgi:hypothetical membrane protein